MDATNITALSYHRYMSVEVGQQLLSSEPSQKLQSWGKTWVEVGGWLVLLHLEAGGVPADREERGERSEKRMNKISTTLIIHLSSLFFLMFAVGSNNETVLCPAQANQEHCV